MPDLMRETLQKISELPTLPVVSMQVMQLVNSPTSSAYELAKIIEKDVSLATKILKMVNSAYYSLSRKIGNVQQAIGFLGYRKLSQLLVSVSVMKDLEVETRFFSMKQFWVHSVLTAECARYIAQKVIPARQDDAYTAGLLHDIGKLFLFKYFPEKMETVMKRAEETSVDPVLAEKDEFGMDHGEVGSMLAEQWKLPKFISDACANHHRTERTGEIDAVIVRIVALANASVNQSFHDYCLASSCTFMPQDDLAALGLPPVFLEGIYSEIEKKIEAAEELLSVVRE